MLKLYGLTAAWLLVLMVPIASGTSRLPYCSHSSTSCLSASLSNTFLSRLTTDGSDGWEHEEWGGGFLMPTLELVEVQHLMHPCWAVQSPPGFDTSLVICGWVEAEGDKDIFWLEESDCSGCPVTVPFKKVNLYFVKFGLFVLLHTR